MIIEISGKERTKTWIHPKRLQKNINNWDLVIIDEAHVFLNPDTDRYKKLVVEGKAAGKITAQGVIFLTATPIRKDLTDLQTYSHKAFRIKHPSNGQYPRKI